MKSWLFARTGVTAILCCAILSGCGGGGSSEPKAYSVGGTVSGLAAGKSVVLNNNGGDALTLSSNAAFKFATPLASGASFSVNIATQPAGQTCVVNGGSGSVSTANVANVSIVCTANTYSIGGTLSGLLPGRSVTLLDNAGDPLTLTATGSFTFATQIASGSTYSVTVGTQPIGENCEVTAASGSVDAMNITNVSVSCVATAYLIGGKLSGLLPGGSVTLLNNAGNPLTLTVNGSFTFATPLPPGSAYNVTVGTQPATQTCVLTAASGTVAMADVTSVIVQCPSENALWSGGNVLGAVGAAALPRASLLQASDGNFYGTTVSGGRFGTGTVFRITPDGVQTVIWSFGGPIVDGSDPEQSGLIQGRDGNFYGTTSYGGTHNGGIVFKLTPEGVETVLWNFGGPNDGARPYSGVIQGSDGNFYGTTTVGGAHNGGTVFKVTPTGEATVLWSFDDNPVMGDPGPYGGLAEGSDGNFYGTTRAGGTNNFGTVFKITPAGVESVVWNFTAGADGFTPEFNLLVGSDGKIYGTTYSTIFTITPPGTFKTIYSFGGAPHDGIFPQGGLSQGHDGYLYGATSSGGQSGAGTVFRLTPAGEETVLWDFGIFGDDNLNGIKGVGPYGGVIQGTDGNLYGTTYGGGAHALGTVFKITL